MCDEARSDIGDRRWSPAVLNQDRFVEVIGPAGLRGSVDTAKWPLGSPSRHVGDPAAPIRIQLDDGRVLTVPRGALSRRDDGRYALQGASETDAGADARRREPEAVIPVIHEEPQVSKRQVAGGGVRVRKVSRDREEIINPPLSHEQVTIDRVAVQREVSGPMPIREEDGVIIVPLVEEAVVVRKTWVLREEIRINKQRFEVQRPKRVTLRTEEAIVERLESPEGGDEAHEPSGPESARAHGDQSPETQDQER
jgi:uncharacterized protein (TIGR02271 family)